MAKDKLVTMNDKEILRLQNVEKVDTKGLKQSEAGKLLQISCCQVRRLLKIFRRQGAKGLVSKKRGMPSNNKICVSGGFRNNYR